MTARPDVEIFGSVYRMTVQTDNNGAVLVAYTRDENGRTGRTWIRMDQATVDYLKQRLSPS